jgi:hypothetical protein
MKKALVILLILAVSGGVFAQVKFSGSVSTGFGIGFDDNDDSKPLVDYIRNRGENGINGTLNASYTGGDADDPYGTFGANFNIAASAGKFDGSSIGLAQDGVNLWWRPNSIAYIQLGNGGPNNYGTPGGLGRNQSIGDNAGLKLELTPIGNNLKIGAHAFYGLAKKNFEDMNYGLGVNYTMPSLLNVVANFRYKPEETKDSEGVITKSKDNKFDVTVGANFLGLSAVGLTKLAADFGTYNFGADNAFMGIGEAIQFKALENLLVLDLSGQQYIWTGEGTKDFIPMRYRAGLAYTINKIVPAIQVQYTMGNIPNYNYRNANELGGVGEAKHFNNKDLAALGVSPQLTFNFGPTLMLGYNLQMDMSKDKPSTTTGKTMQHLIYAQVAISF